MNSMLQTYNTPFNQTKISHNNGSKFNTVNQIYREQKHNNVLFLPLSCTIYVSFSSPNNLLYK